MLSYFYEFIFTVSAYFLFIFSSKELKNIRYNIIPKAKKTIKKYYKKISCDIEISQKFFYTKEDGFFIIFFVNFEDNSETLKIMFYFKGEIEFSYQDKYSNRFDILTEENISTSLAEIGLPFLVDEIFFVKKINEVNIAILKVIFGENTNFYKSYSYDFDEKDFIFYLNFTDKDDFVISFNFYYYSNKIILKMPGVSRENLIISDFTKEEILKKVSFFKGDDYCEESI